MDKLIQQILLLTLLFTLCGTFMLVFRLACVRGSGRTLKRLWAIVLILAVLPLQLLPITLPRGGQQQVHFAERFSINENKLVDRLAERLSGETEAEVLPSTDLTTNEVTLAQETETEKENLGTDQPTSERHAQQILTIAQAVILGVWLCGVLGFIVKYQYGKNRLTHGLRRFSHPCQDEPWIELLHACAKRVGVRHPITLWVVDATLPPMSPCLVGWRKPKLYIHASHLNDSLQIEEVFVHELQHFRSMDALYKNAACAVMALHWFNPITYLIMPRLLEDCEMSCDSRTLEVLGEERRLSYMKTILNIAATTQRPKSTSRIALCFCEPSGKQTLKRRYRNVASKRLHPAVRILALCLAMVMIFACVGCQLIGKKKDTLHLLTPLTEEMVRFYYNLSPEDEITQEMLNGVTSLFVFRDMKIINAISDYETETYLMEGRIPEVSVTEEHPFEGQRYTIEELGAFTIVDFEVNYADTEDSFAAARNQGNPTRLIGCMNYVPRNYMETAILATVQDVFNESDGYTQKHINGAGEISYPQRQGDFVYKQFKAYWVLKDYNLLTSDRQRRELLVAFPGCDEYPYYIFDPTASVAEWMRMYVRMAHVGLLENRILEEGTIDPDIFKVFPNLTDLHIVGIPQAK